MKLTTEQIEKLQPYEKNLRAAYKSSYVHMTSADFAKVAEIYTEVYGVILRKSQMNCNTCRLNVLKKLGELYVNATETEQKKETKKGRPKKLTEEKLKEETNATGEN